ncbi:hypothetical protein CFOL_v3_30507 [Cephalotus follicularis]|uniref:CCHC-type domain-containing protein n=1 Tax=Cephalotus follicularis TaxID=3775 RepID=A0A1Q3D3V2_CEPFO|nr:hypothetical protein CFOL_v3_30507 [Cephalotus follicularis]
MLFVDESNNVPALAHTREDIEDYCDAYYSVRTYFAYYNEIIHPIPEADLAPGSTLENIQPPPLKRLQGRPRITGRREAGEPGPKKRSYSVRCSNCREIGHNAKSCQRAPVAKKVSI